MADETLQRVRRIETRLTQAMVALGIDTQAQRPTFDPGSVTGDATIRLPSPHTSVKEIFAAIPDTFSDAIDIFVGDQCVGTIKRH